VKDTVPKSVSDPIKKHSLKILLVESPLKTPFSRNGPKSGFFPGFREFDVVEKYFH
jgi:hypothetical protein